MKEYKNYEENSRKRLEEIISKKIRTSFIGAISNVEEAFGFLWGMFEPRDDEERQLLESAGKNQDYWKERWEQLRNNILDLGNNQLRNAKQEIKQYTIKWNRYQYQFRIIKEN